MPIAFSFLLPPPEEVAFEFQLSLHTKVAMKLLQLDSNLASARHRLVPRKLSESRFWTHYFYRVFVLQVGILECGGQFCAFSCCDPFVTEQDSFRLREEEEREEVERSTGFPEQETFPSPLPRPASPSSPKRSGEMAAEDVVEAKALDYNSEEQPDPSTPEEQESGWDATAIPFPDQAEKAAYQDQVELPELDNLAEGLDQDADMELEGLEGLLDTENDVEIGESGNVYVAVCNSFLIR